MSNMANIPEIQPKSLLKWGALMIVVGVGSPFIPGVESRWEYYLSGFFLGAGIMHCVCALTIWGCQPIDVDKSSQSE